MALSDSVLFMAYCGGCPGNADFLITGNSQNSLHMMTRLITFVLCHLWLSNIKFNNTHVGHMSMNSLIIIALCTMKIYK